ncbi:MAG TPA: DUF87 domain-containing protein [Nitrososphaerales archaeon]|nr:DUF87 domain-containing protein [Nitrososphaerales archaeon]
MPTIDIVQLVHSALDRNREIPAILDAYSEFLDSPIGPIELRNLSDVFERIQDNLSQRFPEIAAKRAGNVARNDIVAFLNATNGDPDRVKQILRNELLSYKETMIVSIAERFSRMNGEERRVVDATLRLIYRSPFDILFRADAGKQLASSGKEFEKFFASVKSQSPTIRELRYENLIIEKAIFNKLILKAQDRSYFIWIPSFFAKEGAGALIQRLGLTNEHIMLARLHELPLRTENFEEFFRTLTDNLGVLGKTASIPRELSDFVQHVGDYQIIPPIDLDDVFTFLREEGEKKERARLAEEEELRLQEEQRRQEQNRKNEQFRQRFRPVVEQRQQTVQQLQQVAGSTGGKDSIFLGQRLDFDQLVSAINRRVPERELPAQVKQVGEFHIHLPNFQKNVIIVGSSGSGRSTTTKRLLDGMAKSGSKRVILIDQKGEHRGLAWKYGWKVFSFAADSQAQEFQVSLFSSSGDPEANAALGADLIQEWFNQGSLNATDQQKERIASILRAQPKENLNLVAISGLMTQEPDLSELGQKLKKGLVSKSTFSRIFSDAGWKSDVSGSVIFDISGRGLRDPTTREERQIISVILLREILNASLKDSVVVVEDTLDRFKSDSLRTRTIELVKKLLANGNVMVATSRSSVSEFLSENVVEIVHRLSGEKIINEELAKFESDIPSATLQKIVPFLPRGYAITSKYAASGGTVRSAGIRVEPLTFS